MNTIMNTSKKAKRGDRSETEVKGRQFCMYFLECFSFAGACVCERERGREVVTL